MRSRGCSTRRTFSVIPGGEGTGGRNGETFIISLPLLIVAMPVDQNAASSYERNTDGNKWSQGVQDGDIESGLSDAGVSNVQGSGLQQKWSEQVNQSQDEYEQGTADAGDDWLQSMSDASDWNI